jgi:hypothetical protein
MKRCDPSIFTHQTGLADKDAVLLPALVHATDTSDQTFDDWNQCITMCSTEYIGEPHDQVRFWSDMVAHAS